ncbi:RelA/SpoT domain-containing protein [Pluralibacter gergoviae]|nr:RelA/SpoT domain-containing protein [Pluralibacter gergoviae]ELC3018582.1 RelA/SpoT domain-containing protein [Pluralibacter gergoviae]ELC3023707.1 RelA/SpoT domain-containing protein [Pluralibacter gergoviae]
MSKAIKEFISRYEKEFDFYQNLSLNVEGKIKNYLSKSGVRAIVSSRAKSMTRLDVKLEDRDKKKNYKHVNEIYDDIVDLAGVRVALYFPGDMKLVEEIIGKNFKIHKSKKFPESLQKKTIGTYTKVFDGYSAAHFRVSLNDETRYAKNHCVEIQVASVLMHAWSEVEHDLVYKPLQGELSNEELMILDEINGLVLSGNIALERLQKAGLHRVNDESNKIFLNHYDFASFVLSRMKIDEELFDFRMVFSILKICNLNTKDNIENIVNHIPTMNSQIFSKDKNKINHQQEMFIMALANIYPSEVIVSLLRVNYDGGELSELVVKILRYAIIYKTPSMTARKIIESAAFLHFELEIFGRDSFELHYKDIINITGKSDSDLKETLARLELFNANLNKLKINEKDIDSFIRECTSLAA